MAPKKKTIMAIGLSGAEWPVPVRASSGPVADRTRAAVREHQHRPGSQSLASGVIRAPGDGPHAAKSKDGAGPSKDVVTPPVGGTAASKTPTPAPTVRSSQVVRDERRHHAEDTERRRGKSPVYHSRDAEDLHARRGTGENSMQP